jgi:phospholipid/cholesterol/gamma-HCH transport system substrate-binding protein
VGEVVNLKLTPENPKLVVATVGIDPAAPVRADTNVGIDFQGLTGSPVILLSGGSAASPAVASVQGGGTPMLIAEADSGQSMTQAARGTLRRLDSMLSDNAAPLRDVIANFKTFSDALARNSDRVDNVVAGLERMTGGAAARGKLPIYTLAAVRNFSPLARPKRGQLAVPEPAALMSLSSDKILIAQNGNEGASIDNAQWSDNLPVLVQAKLIESLENSGYFQAVGRPIDGYEADQQLLTELRSFRIVTEPAPAATVVISAKLLSNGRMLATRVFDASVPLATVDGSIAAAGLNEAFRQTLQKLVEWAAENASDVPPPAPEHIQ